MNQSTLELCYKVKCPAHIPCLSAAASSKPPLSPGSTVSSSYRPHLPTSSLPTCSLTRLISHPLTTCFIFLAAFTLLVYGLYLLTPNLRSPKQKPLRSTPLMEYNRAFERLVEDLNRVIELGGHEEVLREYERWERTRNGMRGGFGTVEHVGEILEGLRNVDIVGKFRDEAGRKKQKETIRKRKELDINVGRPRDQRVGLSRRATTY
ncbi:hypothetical protein ONS96_002146 [Cadophora gregata f. sp. sojae]|nr:hypothetical protein ONS96_002146 [Cadophora gregata f. sp. sojae]